MGFKQTDINRFLKLAKLLKKNQASEEMLKINKWDILSREVLPRLESMDCAFDIRCRIEKSKIDTTIPIILTRFRLTSEEREPHRELVFQMDVGTLRHLARDLTEMYRRAKMLKQYSLKKEGKT